MMHITRLIKGKSGWIAVTLGVLLLGGVALAWWQVPLQPSDRIRAMLFGVPSATDNVAAVTAMDSQNVILPLARLGDGRGTKVVFDAQGTQMAVATDVGLYLYDNATLARTQFWETATPVQSVAFAADGTAIAFSTMSENQKLYRGALGHAAIDDALTVVDLNESLMHGLAYSPDGAYLVGVSFYHLFIWDAATLALQVRHAQSAALTKQVIFSPDGRLLAMLYKDTLELWQLDGGVLLETVTLSEGHYVSAETATFAPDSSRIVVAGLREPVLYGWSISADGTLIEQPVHQVADGVASIVDVQFTPAGDRLAVGLASGTVHLLETLTDVAVAAETTAPAVQIAAVDKVAWSPDGAFFAAGVAEGAIHIGSAEPLALTHTLSLPSHAAASKIHTLSFAAESSTLTAVTTTGAVYQWSWADGALIRHLEEHSFGRLNSVAFDADGGQLMVGAEHGAVQVWDWMHSLPVATYHPPGGHVDAVIPAPMAGQFAVATSHSLALGVWADPVYLWEPTAEVPFTTFDTDDTGFVTTCGVYWNNGVYSADGQYLVTTAYAHKALLWRVADGALLQQFEGHESAILDIALSADGALLATASDDEEVRIWQTADGVLQRTIPGHAGGAVAVAFAPDGQALATRSAFGDVTLWSLDGSTGQRLLTDVRNPRSNLAFSPDGTWLASGGRGNRAYLWRVTEQGTDPTQVYRLEGHNGIVNDVAFAPDGALLATASADGTVALWEMPSR